MSRQHETLRDRPKSLGFGNPSQPGRIEKPQNSSQAVNRLLAYLSPFRFRLWIVFFRLTLKIEMDNV